MIIWTGKLWLALVFLIIGLVFWELIGWWLVIILFSYFVLVPSFFELLEKYIDRKQKKFDERALDIWWDKGFFLFYRDEYNGFFDMTFEEYEKILDYSNNFNVEMTTGKKSLEIFDEFKKYQNLKAEDKQRAEELLEKIHQEFISKRPVQYKLVSINREIEKQDDYRYPEKRLQLHNEFWDVVKEARLKKKAHEEKLKKDE